MKGYILCLLVLFWTIVPSWTAGEAKPIVPKKLDVYVGGKPFPTWHIALHGRTLEWVQELPAGEHSEIFRITPNDEELRVFRETLEAIHIWQWHIDYPNQQAIMDPTQWRVEVVYADCRIASRGEGNFPGPHGEFHPSIWWTPEFQSFVDAVRKLVGNPALTPAVGVAPKGLPQSFR